MKKIVIMLLTVCLCTMLFGCGSKNAEKKEGDTIVMATNAEFPPYEYIEGSDIVGIDIEFSKAIADKLGMKLEIEDMAFDSIISAVQSGKADFGAAGMTVTDERKKQVDFSVSYYTGKQVIIVKEGSSIKSADDLEGKKIGVQLGTTGDIYTSSDYGDENIEKFNKGYEAVLSLSQGKIDAVVIDDQPAKEFIKEINGLQILESEYVSEDYAMVFKKGSNLVEKFNKAIKELKEDGTFDAIIAKYINNN